MYTNFEIFLANFSFLILFISMLIYWVQASNSVGNKKKDSFLTIKETKFSLSQKIVSVFNGVYSERAVGTLATMIANASLFLLLVLRWKESGHFPLSNLYESLMFLSWSLTLIHLFIEIGFSSHHSRLPHSACPPLHSASLTLAPLPLRGKGQGEGEGPTLTRGGGNKGAGTQSALIFDQPQTQKGLIASRLIGSITAPSALFTNAFATFSLPKEMQEASPLVPALQSNWLMMHVTVMILSYAALILGSLLSIGFLVITSGQNINLSSNAEAITQSTILNKVSPQTLPFGFNFNVFNPIPPFTPPLLNTPLGRPPSVAELIPGGQGGEGGALTASDALVMTNQLENKKEYAPKGHMPGGQKGSGTKSAELHLHEHTDKINVRESYRLNLARTLDNLSYRVLGLGFPLLTIGILSGAVWANEAWGSYWSWDPKETWALLTWLVFAIYLHTRLTKGWEGRKPALIASLGFVTVWVCFLGVNLIGEGLHSYGWIAQS